MAPGSGPEDDFERAADSAAGGIFREFWDYLRATGKWWLSPILFLLLLLGVLSVLAGSAAAPFIYALF
jgi:hypothetical protein